VELLAKTAAERSKKGVVGNIGKKIPMNPRNKLRNPIII